MNDFMESSFVWLLGISYFGTKQGTLEKITLYKIIASREI